MPSITKYIPNVTIYGIILSGLYLYSYWSSFGLNAFEYASPGSIFVLACVGIFSVTIPFIIGILVALIWPKLMTVWNKFRQQINKSNISTADIPNTKKRKKYFNFHYFFIAFLLCTAIFRDNSYQWLLYGYIIGIPLSIFLFKKDFFSEIANSKNRHAAIWFIVSMPFIALFAGSSNAAFIISGRSYQYTEYTHQAEKIPQKIEQKLRYLGTIGEHVFLYEPESASAIITTMSHIGVLQLHEYKKSSSESQPKPSAGAY